LSIDEPSKINFAHSRINILKWLNIIESGAGAQTIDGNVDLEEFASVFAEFSLFHYFAQDVEVIEMIHAKWKVKLEDEILTERERDMPFILLHPDVEGRTAIDYAYYLERPRSADLMIDLLEPFWDRAVSKMLTESIPDMLQEGSDFVLKFFATALYQPITVQDPIMVMWPEDTTEHLFTTETSLVTKSMLDRSLASLVAKEEGEDEQESGEGAADGSPNSSLRPQVLLSGDNDQTLMKRVKIELLDMDWVFRDDNASTLIQLMVSQDNTKMFV
jgi:hypothetical protein